MYIHIAGRVRGVCRLIAVFRLHTESLSTSIQFIGPSKAEMQSGCEVRQEFGVVCCTKMQGARTCIVAAGFQGVVMHAALEASIQLEIQWHTTQRHIGGDAEMFGDFKPCCMLSQFSSRSYTTA